MNESSSYKSCAIVTGAGEGIGREIAIQLAAQGTSVIINDINPESAESVRNHITDQGGHATTVLGDASDIEVIESLVLTAVENFGRIDYTIANAGITTFGAFLEYPTEKFHELVKVNLFGSFFLAQAVAKQYIKQKSEGRILFMSSVTGHQAHPNLAAYGMTKAALEMLAKQLSVELSNYSITVNAIAPGATLTPRTATLDVHYKSTWERITPLSRVCTPDDIAKCALFLLSEGARQITGQTIIVDGGWTSVSPPPH